MQTSVSARKMSQEKTRTPHEVRENASFSEVVDILENARVAGTGFEREPFHSGNSHIAGSDSAKCSALLPDSIMADDESLREVIRAWPNLPTALQQAILAIVRAG